ncbi:MAG: isochorismatase family protein [Pseudonocardiaceae bacterium]
MTETVPGVDFDDRSALVVVDVQNDFADPRGGLYVQGGDQIVRTINGLVAAARAADAIVVYTQDWHPSRTPHFVTDGGPWPVHCVQGSWGAELHPDLEVAGPVVRKGTGGEDGYSGFTARDVHTGERVPTDLDGILRQHEIARVVVVGLAQDVCVRDTALDARLRGYDTTVLLAATRPVNLVPEDDRTANEAMTAAGVTLR